MNLILSGPAGGVLGAVEFARLAREPNLITIDMGGTSLDASLVVGGEALVQHEASFEGLPIMVPSLEIHTIGAGGGSVLWADAGGHLQVGPHSAGARPGPAAYGIGGAEATITDAALVCGYLSPESALAGTLRLDSDLASTAVANLAVGLGIDAQDVAAGAMQIAVTKTAGAVRAITVDQGYTPSDFGLLAFGGAGGLVATSVARELQVSRVIVPRGAGSFSAWGMLMANVHHELAQTFVAELDRCDAERIDRVLLAMEADGRRALKDDGFDEGKQRFLRLADLRYKGQEHSVTIGVARSVDKAEVLRLKSAFSRAHGQRYGHALDDPVEIVTLRSRAVGVVARPPMPKVPARSGDALASIGARRVYAGTGKWSTYGVYRYGDLRAGDVVVGPAIVDDTTGTTVLHSGDSGRVGTMGELQISVVGASHGS